MNCNLFKIFEQNQLKYGFMVNFVYPLEKEFDRNTLAVPIFLGPLCFRISTNSCMVLRKQ